MYYAYRCYSIQHVHGLRIYMYRIFKYYSYISMNICYCYCYYGLRITGMFDVSLHVQRATQRKT
jgi:hypothetical protein